MGAIVRTLIVLPKYFMAVPDWVVGRGTATRTHGVANRFIQGPD